MNDAVHAAPNGASRNGDDALGENEKAALLARIADKDDQIADLRRRRSIRRPRSAAG